MAALLCFAFLLGVHSAAGDCTFPEALRGKWTSSSYGALTFSDSDIGPITSQNRLLNFHCFIHDTDQYVIKSDVYSYGGINFAEYICLDIHRISDEKFKYYVTTGINKDHRNQRIVVLTNDRNATKDEVCTDMQQSNVTGAYSFLLKDDSIEKAAVTCPDDLLAIFNVTLEKCPNGASMDACTDNKQLDFNYTQCDGTSSYSGEIVYKCLYGITSNNNLTYVTLYKSGANTGQNSFIPFSCMTLSSAKINESSVVHLTHSPRKCSSEQNSTFVKPPGVAMVLTATSTCHLNLTTPTPGSETTPGSSGTRNKIESVGYLFLFAMASVYLWIN